jgi:hypothetical protein
MNDAGGHVIHDGAQILTTEVLETVDETDNSTHQ